MSKSPRNVMLYALLLPLLFVSCSAITGILKANMGFVILAALGIFVFFACGRKK